LDDVIEFPKVKVLSEDEALDYLRREGPIEGISKFAKLVGWERTRAQRMLARWQRDGTVVLKPGGPGGKTAVGVLRAAVGDLPAARAPAQPPVPRDAQLSHARFEALLASKPGRCHLPHYRRYHGRRFRRRRDADGSPQTQADAGGASTNTAPPETPPAA
jgi:hypothetical protein